MQSHWHPRHVEIFDHIAAKLCVPSELMLTAGTHVVSRPQDDRARLTICECGASSVILAPIRFIDELQRIAANHGGEGVDAITLTAELRNDDVSRFPAEVMLYLHGPRFKPLRVPGVRKLDQSDSAAVTQLHRACPAIDQKMSDVSIDHPAVFGCFVNEELAAAASFIDYRDAISDVGVLVHPQYRRRSLGCAVVSALATYGLNRDRIVQYCHAATNTASGRLAERLGFTSFAKTTVIQFHADGACDG